MLFKDSAIYKISGIRENCNKRLLLRAITRYEIVCKFAVYAEPGQESTSDHDLDRQYHPIESDGVPLSWPRLSGVPGLASLTITNTERRTKKRKVSRNAVERSGHMVASDAGIAWLVREAMDSRGRIKLRKLSRSRMSRAAVSATKLKQCVRKQPTKIRKCMCLPSNYALVEFPVVWSELRFVNFELSLS